MSPSMMVATVGKKLEEDEFQYQKGVKHLCENSIITRVPNKYILPVEERPNSFKSTKDHSTPLISLPIVDFAALRGSSRATALESLSRACEEFGFFQLVNHGISDEVIRSMTDVSTRFFAQSYEERAKYMSADMMSPVRYGTSFNQTKDRVFCWRDFLKITCHRLSDGQPEWPSSPADMRKLATIYAEETKHLFLKLMEAILESFGLSQEWAASEALSGQAAPEELANNNIMEQFKDGSQLMVVNCYPPCPQPDLTLGMPPHSDYGFLTLLLQDQVRGLQIQHQEKWVTVKPIPNAFVVNVGDHLEIFSNGKYRSVLHRVLVNPSKPRISVATLHSLPHKCIIRPCPGLINDMNPARYKETDFASFLAYISSREPKMKNFLESRKLTN